MLRKQLFRRSCRRHLPWFFLGVVMASLKCARAQSQDIRTVASEEDLMQAFESKAAHIHLVSHLDLRSCRGYNCDSASSYWVFEKPAFKTLTVRCCAIAPFCHWGRLHESQGLEHCTHLNAGPPCAHHCQCQSRSSLPPGSIAPARLRRAAVCERAHVLPLQMCPDALSS